MRPDPTPPASPAAVSAPLRPVEELRCAECGFTPSTHTHAEGCSQADRARCGSCSQHLTVDRLLARLRAAEETLAAVGALAEDWRYKGEFGWGPWQLGEGPDPEGYVLDECATLLRAVLAEGASR